MLLRVSTDHPEQQPDPEQQPARSSARDLVRRRSRTYAAPDTGRMHHIGGAPDAVPVHTEDGVAVARTTSWQLADRTPVQLTAQRSSTEREMAEAARVLDFERAGRLRDDLVAVDAELARRAAAGSRPSDG